MTDHPASGLSPRKMFQAMAAGDWRGARDAFSAVLVVAEVPEALFGLAQALWVAAFAVFLSGGAEVVVVEGGAGEERFFSGGLVVVVVGEVFVGEVDHEQGVDEL